MLAGNVVATCITPDDTFWECTDGASAIQSRSYKTIESLCRRPDEDRLAGLAMTLSPRSVHAYWRGSQR
jgi:hypothetical protein